MTRSFVILAALLLSAPAARADLAPSPPAPPAPSPPTAPACGTPEWEALHASLTTYCAVETAHEAEEVERHRLRRACRHLERALRHCAPADRLVFTRDGGKISGSLRDPSHRSHTWQVSWTGPRIRPRVDAITFTYDGCDC
jgi:hypothetical protein